MSGQRAFLVILIAVTLALAVLASAPAYGQSVLSQTTRRAYLPIVLANPTVVGVPTATATSEAPACLDSFEPDDVIGQARSIFVNEAPQLHTVSPPGDIDYVKFTAKTGWDYVLRTLNLVGRGNDTWLTLYGTDGNTLLLENDDDLSNPPASRIDWTCPATGVYYALVQQFDASLGGCGLSYQLDLTGGPGEATPTTQPSPTPSATSLWMPTPTATGAPVATYTPTPTTPPSNPLEIIVCAEPYDQFRPAVACNPSREEYLVTYQWGKTYSDIHAQRVSRYGELLGARIVVSDSTERERAPQVAYNSHDDQYLVVWHGGDGEEILNSRNYIYGQRLSGAGTLLGSTIPICTSTRWNISSTVAYNSVNNEYLVVWQDGVVNINGQRISASGSPVGGSFVICGANRQQNDVTMAYNPHANEYLVVYDDFRNNTHYDIFGTRISGYGSPYSPDIPICTLTGDQLFPDVGYCSASTGYLVAWPDLRTGSLYPDLYYALVSEQGWVGGVAPLSQGVWGQIDPDVAFDPVANEYQVVWTNNRPWDVHGVRLSPSGDFTGVETRFTTNPAKQHQPAIAIDPNTGAYLIAWEDYRSEREFDIYAYVQP